MDTDKNIAFMGEVVKLAPSLNKISYPQYIALSAGLSGIAQQVAKVSDPVTAIEVIKGDQGALRAFKSAAASLVEKVAPEVLKPEGPSLESVGGQFGEAVKTPEWLAGDSWLSKNVRPVVLLLVVGALVVAYLVPDYPAEKLEALKDLAVWVTGYYFMGRSLFDKGAISWKKQP